LQKLEEFANQTGKWNIEFSGGEPSIYPNFAQLCTRLAENGHKVMFYSNGVTNFSEVFDEQSIKAIRRVTLSYHVDHERKTKLDTLFDENIKYLQHHGIEVRVNYVLYPERNSDAKQLEHRFEKLGVDFRLRVFQGKYQNKEYPFDYTDQEKQNIISMSDVHTRYLIEHGDYMSTFKACDAGYRAFYLFLHTGELFICEQLQQQAIVNVLEDDAVTTFNRKRLKKPIICPAKKCMCRFTVAQEVFMETKDPKDMNNYAEWEAISLPSDKALAHWEKKEKSFVKELEGKLIGNNVYLWGGGVHSVSLLRTLRKYNFPIENIKGIIDSNPLQHGKQLNGLKITSKQELTSNKQQICSDIIISSRSFEQEIKEDIELNYGNTFNTICLYDGSMKNRFEMADE